MATTSERLKGVDQKLVTLFCFRKNFYPLLQLQETGDKWIIFIIKSEWLFLAFYHLNELFKHTEDMKKLYTILTKKCHDNDNNCFIIWLSGIINFPNCPSLSVISYCRNVAFHVNFRVC